MKTFFKELLEYNHHFNAQLIRLLDENSSKVPEKSIRLMSHIVNAQQVWNSRMLHAPSPGVWDVRPLADLIRQEDENFIQGLEILETKDLSEVIAYTNTKGEAFSNSVRDIFFHVANHSNYHRAQIASDCKPHGIEPLVTDYIFYKR